MPLQAPAPPSRVGPNREKGKHSRAIFLGVSYQKLKSGAFRLEIRISFGSAPSEVNVAAAQEIVVFFSCTQS